MNIVEDQETLESIAPSPVLPRLDRLDRLLQLLEEKHRSDLVVQKGIKPEDDHRKTLSSALEEVQHKGTLLERLTILENRVLQLSLEMDAGNTSNSSSSPNRSTEKLDPGFKSGMTHEKPGNQSPVADVEQGSNTSSVVAQKIDSNKGRRKRAQKNWLGWFHWGCN